MGPADQEAAPQLSGRILSNEYATDSNDCVCNGKLDWLATGFRSEFGNGDY
jgi:hypothetical protein